MAKQWFVGTCKNQQELRAEDELWKQGFVCYLPKIHYRHQDGRKIEARTALRFPGYIFIQFDAELKEHGPISSTRGMDELLVSVTDVPIPLPAGIIEMLRHIENQEYARAVARKKPRPRSDLTPGDPVQIAGDRGHPAFGQRGSFLGSDKGIASVLGGIAVWKVAECDLKKMEPAEQKRAA